MFNIFREQILRGILIRIPAALLLAGMTGTPHVLDSSPLKRDARIRALRMDVFACGARLTWHTHGNTLSFVQYGKNFGRRTLPAAKPRSWHEAELGGLKPGRSYNFRIIVRRPGSVKFSLTYRIRARAPRVFRVPGQMALGKALEQAGACDEIRVAPGTYPAGIRIPRGVRLTGAGAGKSILDGRGKKRVVSMSDESVLRGFTIRGSGREHWDSGVWFTGSTSPIIEDNRIENNSMGIAHYCWGPCKSGARIRRNVIVNNLRVGLHLEKAAARVRNNTIHGNDRGIYLKRGGIRIHDNIIAGNRRSGLAGEFRLPSRDIKNNILHANGPGGYHAPGQNPDERAGAGNLLRDPLTRAPARGDFRLSAGSPARGAGTGGTDLGALPFRPRGNAPARLKLKKINGNAPGHARRYRLVAREKSGTHYLYLALGKGPYSRRMPVRGGEIALNGLPAGMEVRAALSTTRGASESDLSPVLRFRVPANEPGLHRATANTLRARGAWHEKIADGARLIAKEPGARLFFEFQGESLVLYRSMGPAGGRADILVDGKFRGSIGFRFHASRRNVPAVIDNLGPGPHRLEVRVRPGGEVALEALRFPAPYSFTSIEQRALKRVNFHRRRAGLTPLLPAWSMQLAARSHSRYFLRHRRDERLKGLGFHREYPGLTGFTGVHAAARGAYFGFDGGAGEAGHFTGDPLWAVDGWMSTVYHRAPIMDYAATRMGYGSAGDANFRVDTLNTGHGPSAPRAHPSRRLLYTYPAHKQKNVPHDWDGAEIPDPLPNRDAKARKQPVGFPLSLYIVHPRGAKPREKNRRAKNHWSVGKAELRDSRGRKTAIHVLDAKSDPNSVLRPGTVFLVARRALKLGERYTAYVSGSDALGAPFRHRWSFQTRDAGAIVSMHAEPAACQALLRWRSAGNVKSYLEYAGPGETFRRFFPSGRARDTFFARVYDLKPGITYRWRVVTITPDRNRTSMTREFRTRNPRVLDVPGRYASIPAAFKAARACDVIRVGPGVYQGPFRLPRGIVLRGTDSVRTILRGDGKDSVLRMSASGEVSGFTITGSGKDYWHSGIWIQDAAHVVIRGNRIRDNANGIVQYCFKKPCRAASRLENNIILRNGRRGIYIRSGTALIIGNSIQAPPGRALEAARGTGITRKGNRIREVSEQ